MRGTVKFFNTERGFGFIRPDDGGSDVFVHISACTGTLREGERVQFEIMTDQRSGKTKAVNVEMA